MAKPFADQGGSGLHIHASAYREDGSNIFAHDEATTPPTLTEPLRRAIGGLRAGQQTDGGEAEDGAAPGGPPALGGDRAAGPAAPRLGGQRT